MIEIFDENDANQGFSKDVYMKKTGRDPHLELHEARQKAIAEVENHLPKYWNAEIEKQLYRLARVKD